MSIHNKQRKLIISALTFLLSAVGFLAFVPTAAADTFPGVNGRIIISELSGSDRVITSAKADGSDVKTVLGGSFQRESVEYSPDGTKIVYTQVVSAIRQVFTANADGSNPQQLTTSTEHTDTPSWSPDGTKILFSQKVSSTVRIVRMNADGTSQTQLTTTAVYYNPAYSPNGTKIVALLDDTDDEVVTMNADGTSITNLTNNSADERSASWAPDGTKLVYSSEVSGSQEIFTMNANGSSQTQLTSVGDGYSGPVYSPDGTKIAFHDGLAPGRLFVANTDGTNVTDISFGWPLAISWQPLTHKPSSSAPNPTVSLSGGKASVNVAAMYTDTYDGIDKATVAATSTPASGTTSVDATTGVITYTAKTAAVHSSWWSNLGNVFFPKVSAATTDSFTYRVCSLASSSLCSTGTITVNLLGAPDTGAGQPSDTSNLMWALAILSAAGIGLGIRKLRRQHRTR